MTQQEFEKLVAEEFPTAVPEKFRSKINNVVLLVEQEPSPELRKREHLRSNETLLGLYQGIPHTARGEGYGVGGALPDTITLYQKPIETEAHELEHSNILQNVGMSYKEWVRKVIRDTIWHEVAHHFGMDEYEVRERERGRDA
jgi:predicted Zn-dependent protease with MMP-like domain